MEWVIVFRPLTNQLRSTGTAAAFFLSSITQCGAQWPRIYYKPGKQHWIVLIATTQNTPGNNGPCSTLKQSYIG
jgi:hypothetical protein